MEIQLDKSSKTPMYSQIVEQVHRLVQAGRLLPGDRLPPERKLAEQLGVNRTTVLSAYRELKAQGLAGSRVGQGTVILAPGEAGEEPGALPAEPEWSHFFSDYAGRVSRDDVSELLNIANRENVISFAAGIAAYGMGPLDAFREAAGRLLREQGRQSLMLSPVEGFYSLRQAISDYMVTRGCTVRPEEIIVLSGSQQGISLLAKVLLDPGDVVVVEEPTYFPALQVFRALGARVMGVAMDEGGMRLDSLEQLLQRYRPKLVYTMPSFQNPTGREMDMARRRRLAALSRQYKVPVLEDDAYGSFCFEGPGLPALKSLDEEGYLLYLSTFTKMVYPGIRVGWLAAHPQIIRRLSAARQLEDLHTNSLSQRIVEELLVSGGLVKHMQRVKAAYRQLQDMMLDALEEYAPEGMRWTNPRGGYYIWCTLPPGVCADRLLELASRRHVAFVPGSKFFTNGEGSGCLRLNYTFVNAGDIRPGIGILCRCVRELAGESQSMPDQTVNEINPIL